MDDRAAERPRLYPLGTSVTADALEADPYPVFARLRRAEPISWIEALDIEQTEPPTGYEFRQPRRLTALLRP